MLKSELPFIAEDEPMNAWRPAVSGDWGVDCATGRRYAEAAVDYVARTGNAPLMANIAREISRRGECGGVEVGFFTRLGSLAAA